jgi:hypothetical protein
MPKIVLLVLVSGLIPLTYAQQKPKELLAAALSVSGEAFFERDGKTAPAKIKTIFFKSDRVFTKKGKIDIQIGPSAVLHLAPYTSVKLADLTEVDKKTHIAVELDSGRGYTKFSKQMPAGSKYAIKSPTMVAAVRGTEFVLSAGDESAEPHEDSDIPAGVFVNTGKVAVSPASREDEVIELAPGEQITGVDNTLVKGVMEDFLKKKMKLFKQLNCMKEAQYKIMEREKNRQIELLEKVRNSSKMEELREKNKKLFNNQ